MRSPGGLQCRPSTAHDLCGYHLPWALLCAGRPSGQPFVAATASGSRRSCCRLQVQVQAGKGFDQKASAPSKQQKAKKVGACGRGWQDWELGRWQANWQNLLSPPYAILYRLPAPPRRPAHSSSSLGLGAGAGPYFFLPDHLSPM